MYVDGSGRAAASTNSTRDYPMAILIGHRQGIRCPCGEMLGQPFVDSQESLSGVYGMIPLVTEASYGTGLHIEP